MNTVHLAFRPATLRLFEISYHCDLKTNAAGSVIPLGILADLSVQGVYGLGLVARKELSHEETEKLGRLIRADLAAPFTYLLDAFNAVYDSASPIEAFSALADQHTHSLLFQRTPDTEITVPRPIVANAVARVPWVKDQLISYGNSAYWKLFDEHVPDIVDKSYKDEARELDKAAA